MSITYQSAVTVDSAIDSVCVYGYIGVSRNKWRWKTYEKTRLSYCDYRYLVKSQKWSEKRIRYQVYNGGGLPLAEQSIASPG